MAKACMITGTSSTRGNNVAHCNLTTRRNMKANLRWKRLYSSAEKRFVRLLVSTKGLRLADKKGVDYVLMIARAKGYKV